MCNGEAAKRTPHSQMHEMYVLCSFAGSSSHHQIPVRLVLLHSRLRTIQPCPAASSGNDMLLSIVRMRLRGR